MKLTPEGSDSTHMSRGVSVPWNGKPEKGTFFLLPILTVGSNQIIIAEAEIYNPGVIAKKYSMISDPASWLRRQGK